MMHLRRGIGLNHLFTASVLALALSGNAMAKPTREADLRIDALMKASVERKAAGDFAGAEHMIAEAEQLFDRDLVLPGKFFPLIAAADIAHARGDTVRKGKLGDPCPHYQRARVRALSAQDMTANDGERERREAAADLLARIDRSAAGAGCAAPPAPRPDPAFAGHYYLSGVMETGSELLLRADGSFEWYMSYGAVDQVAHGAWGSDGGAVILIAEMPSKDKPLFTFREVEPWSEAAEDELLARAYDEDDARVGERCPFLSEANAVVAAPAVPLSGTEAPRSPEQLRADAASAHQRALAARSVAETLARDDLAHPRAANTPQLQLTAAEALGNWEAARWEAIDAARKAGLPEPDLAPPTLPAACTMTPRRTAGSIPKAQWTGGLGVRIYDMASEQGARDVRVTLGFADGKQAELITARRGLALLPGKPASPVVSVGLSTPYAPGRDQTLSIAPTSSGIIDATIDAQQLVTPPFSILRLRIADRALMLDASGSGRYERQP